ncbi:phage major tail tube protein [Schinkia azotoformans]|uniref:phage major tail tube protein n=1 Tax=Schinkia azotoformans TaxID=1454 RepID=UPI002DBE3C36|nr:phage major tail tube protein [Schinkia azotoformans]MEC1744119.1 phage major tail tube protein [Schinkia azotoformans]
MNQVPEKLIAFRVYQDGNDLLGVADVEMPSIEAMTETVKGAGIAGEFESPVIGHYGSMTTKLNWRTLSKPVIHLTQPKAHNLEFRGASQVFDAGSGEYKFPPLKVTMRCTPKKTELGKLDVGAKSDSSNEFEVSYIKVFIDGKAVLEIDKFNYICVIDGVDYLKGVREALGL